MRKIPRPNLRPPIVTCHNCCSWTLDLGPISRKTKTMAARQGPVRCSRAKVEEQAPELPAVPCAVQEV